MNLGKLERFAQMARRELHKQVKARLDAVLLSASLERREQLAVVKQLEQEVGETSRDKVIARVAYTWFNRFCALRFMDANGYNRVRVVSPSEGFIQPELLTEAKQGMFPEEWFTENPPALERVRGLLEGRIPSQSPEQEAYALLLVAACNSLHQAMPYLFEAINNVTELLLPIDLLSPNAVLTYMRDTLDTQSCESVEVIGWLHQFYISEIKDKVMGAKAAVAQDDIPAVTQLFTPRWIVGYLVENSLGRLWLQNRPKSKLRGAMKYYLEEAEQQLVDSGKLVVDREQQQVDRVGTIHSQLSTIHYPNYPFLSSPKDIRLMDPACGSGHILVYAFDLLVEIYREEGFEDHEIAGLILEHNLVGLDIDERVAELASFALTMKARSLSRRFLSNPVQPKVCALSAPGLNAAELEDYQKRVGKDLFSPGILSSLKQWEDAPHFGSLIRPKAGDVEALRQKLASLPLHEDLVLAPTHAKILKALEQIALVGAKVHCVVANPPYMGSGKMNGALKEFVKKEYPNAKADLCVCFIKRGFDWLVPHGFNALVTMHSWMFLSSFEDFRNHWLANKRLVNLVHLGARAFDGIGGEVVQTAAFVWENAEAGTQPGSYVRLVNSDAGSAAKEAAFFSGEDRFNAKQVDFAKIPGSPIAYWINETLIRAFSKGLKIGDVSTTRKGMATGLNAALVRQWSEVDHRNVGIGLDRIVAKDSGLKWFPYANGGSYRKWYGHFDDVVLWENDGYRIQTDRHETADRVRAVNLNLDYIFREGFAWTSITAGNFSSRYLPVGSLFSSASNAIFSDVDLLGCFGMLNSSTHLVLGGILNPTINANPGDIAKIPYIKTNQSKTQTEFSVRSSKLDWDSFETSWDFPGHPLLSQGNWSTQPNGRLRLPGETDAENPNSIDLSVQWLALKGATLAESYAAWRSFAEQQTAELKRLEEENNRLFIDAYGLQGELTPEVPLKEITLTVNPVYRFGEGKSADEYDKLCREAAAKELISYAVGCLFGRYSLDRPGLILANAGETLEDFVRRVGSGKLVVDSKNSQLSTANYPLSTVNYPLRTQATAGSVHVSCDELQRSDRVAKGYGSCGNGVSGNEAVPEGRTLRTDESGQAVGSFDSFQHSGRPRQEVESRISQLLVHCERFKNGNGNPNPACPALELCNEKNGAIDPRSVRGSESAPVRSTQQPEINSHSQPSTPNSPLSTVNCQLSTIHFLPDDDNVIPLLEEDWFEDGLYARLKEWLKVAWGPSTLEQNLSWLEDALGKDLRKYLARDFYKDHVSTYRKRPIYWLFQSPAGAFQALIYLHRYTADTVGVVLNDYVRQFVAKLEGHRKHLLDQSIDPNATQGQKTKALKELDRVRKQLEDLGDYDRDILFPLASQRIALDLDDGVRVNYPKLGAALKRIPGLEGEE